jgi:hypothetical protein
MSNFPLINYFSFWANSRNFDKTFCDVITFSLFLVQFFAEIMSRSEVGHHSTVLFIQQSQVPDIRVIGLWIFSSFRICPLVGCFWYMASILGMLVGHHVGHIHELDACSIRFSFLVHFWVIHSWDVLWRLLNWWDFDQVQFLDLGPMSFGSWFWKKHLVGWFFLGLRISSVVPLTVFRTYKTFNFKGSPKKLEPDTICCIYQYVEGPGSTSILT